MWTTAVLSAALFSLVAGSCHRLERDYYDAIGCKPSVMGEDSCPISYDCSSLKNRDPNKCYFQGKTYEKSQPIQDTGDECLTHCRCDEGYSGRTSVMCINIECPEHFSGRPKEGCYHIYEHKTCCNVGEVCSADQSPEQKASRPVCQYKNQVYQVGQKFYPEEKPCLTCICQAGFNGSLVEPFCRKINCNLEAHYSERIAEGCSPIYLLFKGVDQCCPIDWRCPEKSDTVIPSPSADSKSSGLHCQFGDLQLPVGARLSDGPDANIECSCRVPPHVVCVKRE